LAEQKVRPKALRWRAPRSGACRVCGCTDNNACDGGCWWVETGQVEPAHTLCSSCAGQPGDLEYVLHWIDRLLASHRPPIAFIKVLVRGVRRRRLQATCAR